MKAAGSSEQTPTTRTGKELERWVANVYRQMGAQKVEHDVEMGGNQIDVYVEMEAPGRLLHRIAVEVKDWSTKVGIDVVNGFAAIVRLLRDERSVDEGVIISATGFSRQARNAARQYGIQLLEPADLEAMAAETQATRPTSPAPVIPTRSSAPQLPSQNKEIGQRPRPEARTPDRYHYDAFVSYSHRDKEWVHCWLLPRLDGAGLRTCIDFRDFEPGAPSLTEMERAVLQSRKTLLVLTPDYLASEWAEFESILASTLDPAARRRRVIPLLLRPCELPLRIQALTYVDFTGSDYEFQFRRLVVAIQSEPKPGQPSSTQQSVQPEASDLRLLVADPCGKQLVSRLEFLLPPRDPDRQQAGEITFRLHLDNQSITVAHYVIAEILGTSNTDSFWTYRYNSESFTIEESPRPWQVTLSSEYIRCYFEGGAEFVCHGKAQQSLGLVKMLAPYGQSDTTVTFDYRVLAEGCETHGSFAIVLKPRC